MSSYLDRRPGFANPAAILPSIAAAAHPDAALISFQPHHDQFQKLRRLYVKLRASAPKKPDASISASGPMLAPGQTHADVAVLRRRLDVAASGDASDVYDPTLVTAVKAFQTAAGLRADGFVGKKTRAALSADGSEKISSVLANMEEWRWMPEDLGKTHLFINVPSFSIDLVEDGKPVLSERVIAGKNSTQTPIFSKELTAIVLKPSWYLPDSIKLEKLLSAQRRGSPIENEGYKIKKGNKPVESWTVDWNTANLKDYAIFQPSGDRNALGDVKFLFPNKHSVYLHDTPMKSLFEASDRLFSHGCVRLRNPLSLAQRLLDDDKGPGAIKVKSLINDGPGNNQVTLDRPLPVHAGYFTVWVNADGETEFLGDPYGHEQRITLALQQKWDAIDKGADHLAAVDTQQLKAVSIQSAPKRVAQETAAPRRFAPPSGVTRALAAPESKPVPKQVKYVKYRSDKDSVGEMMRQALQH